MLNSCGYLSGLVSGHDYRRAEKAAAFAISGCPTLAAPLFLRLGWDSTIANPLVTHERRTN